jgi:Protein of unknown function (DUF3152)
VRRSLAPLVLLLILIGVVVIAAVRGSRNDEPAFTGLATPSSSATSDPDPGPTSEPTPSTGSDSADEATDEGPEPSPAEEPTPTPGRRLEDLPLSGPGTFTYAPGAGEAVGTEPYRRFTVAAEDESGVDPVALAAFVDDVLGDPRSWIADTHTGFVRVGEGEEVDFIIAVAAPQTVDALCAPLETISQYSCGRNGWIALNLFRWETATDDWPGSLDVYRHYLLNHEVGHYILGPNHQNECPAKGDPAPIMMQQTIDLHGCAPNGWVYPANTG